MFRFKPVLFVIGAIILLIGVLIWAASPLFNKLFFKNDVISYDGVIVNWGCYLSPMDDGTYTSDLVVDVGGSAVEVQLVTDTMMSYKDGQKVTVYELKGYRSLDSEQVYDNPRNHIIGRFVAIFGIGILVMSVFRSRKYNWLRDFAN